MTILCVNLNSAIDKTVRVRQFQLDKIHRPEAVLAMPGGKGCNVARALKTLGEDPIITGWVGGHAGRYIEEGLQKEGLQTAFVNVPAESRTCLSILDPELNTLTEIYEKGEPITGEFQEAFLNHFSQLLDQCQMVTLSGSLPTHVPADFYSRLITLAQEKDIPALLDTSGEALKIGYQNAKPSAIKPNRHEFQSLVRIASDNLVDVAQAASTLNANRDTLLVVSLGKEGLLANQNGQCWHIVTPAVQAISAVGSGDCTLAGLAYGLTHNYGLENTLRLAAAVGAANTMEIGAGRFKKEDVESLLNQVSLRSL